MVELIFRHTETHASDTKGGKTFSASNASAALGRLKTILIPELVL
jgi:hypothetical protein